MKITLKNLAQADEQDVFDQVATHLLTQMERCVDASGFCKYRNERGYMCAAGCLIADDEYSSDLEGSKWSDLQQRDVCTDIHADLIEELQHVHDTKDPDTWRYILADLAEYYNLNTKALEKFKQ